MFFCEMWHMHKATKYKLLIWGVFVWFNVWYVECIWKQIDYKLEEYFTTGDVADWWYPGGMQGL